MQSDNYNNNNALEKRSLLPTHSSTSMLISRYRTFDDFQKAYATVNIQAVALVPDKCFSSESSPVLSVIGDAYGRQAPVAWLISILSQWQEQIPVQGKMTLMQIHLLADNIVRHFFYLRASEILLFIARLTGGAYSVQWYGQISPDVIFSTLRDKFMPERSDTLHRIEAAKAAERAKEQGEPITWEEYCRRHGLGDRANPLEDIEIGE